MSSSPDPVEAARGRAFRELVEPEIEVLLRVARTMTASAADAEDLGIRRAVRQSRSAGVTRGSRTARAQGSRTSAASPGARSKVADPDGVETS